MSTTSPAPSASPTPAPTSGKVAGLTINVPSGNSGKTKKPPDLYGLKEWQTQSVDPGDLPFLANSLADGQPLKTAEDVVKAFAQLRRPDQIGTIQNALHMAGFYTGNYIPDYGNINQQDISAFADAVKLAGRAGMSVSDLLTTHAAAGMKLGIQLAQQQTQSRKSEVTTVTLPNTQDLEAEANAAFQKIVGKNATPEQEARFAAFYRSMVAGAQRAQNQAMYDATHPPPLPDALAQADPAQLAGSAAGDVTVQGPANAGNMNPAVNTGGAANDPYVTPTFSDKVGGLMSLGQAVSAAQQHGITPTGGLTQITQDSVPSANVAAENFARNADPHGAAANDTANTFQTFLGLLTRNFG